MDSEPNTRACHWSVCRVSCDDINPAKSTQMQISMENKNKDSEEEFRPDNNALVVVNIWYMIKVLEVLATKYWIVNEKIFHSHFVKLFWLGGGILIWLKLIQFSSSDYCERFST